MSAELRFDATGKALPAHRYPLLMVLDEFAAIGRQEIIEQSLARCLGYGVTGLIVCQDISQLHRAYGQHQNVSNNANIRVCFPPNEVSTAEWISKQLGQTTVATSMRSEHAPRGLFKWRRTSESFSTQYTARSLLLADEILTLPKPQRDAEGQIEKPGAVIVIEAGKRAILGEQLLYWEDDEMRRRSLIPPYPGSNFQDTADFGDNVTPLRPRQPWPMPAPLPAVARRAAGVIAAVAGAAPPAVSEPPGWRRPGTTAASGQRSSAEGQAARLGRRLAVPVGSKGHAPGRLPGEPKLLPEKDYKDFTPPPRTIPRIRRPLQGMGGGLQDRRPHDLLLRLRRRLTEAVLLGTVSYRLGKPFTWDAKELRASEPDADRFLRKEYRKPWTLG